VRESQVLSADHGWQARDSPREGCGLILRAPLPPMEMVVRADARGESAPAVNASALVKSSHGRGT